MVYSNCGVQDLAWRQPRQRAVNVCGLTYLRTLALQIGFPKSNVAQLLSS